MAAIFAGFLGRSLAMTCGDEELPLFFVGSVYFPRFVTFMVLLLFSLCGSYFHVLGIMNATLGSFECEL